MPSPRLQQIRTDAAEPEFRRVVSEHVREVATFLAGSLAELQFQVLEFEATGDDTEIRVQTRFQARPLGVVVLEARNLDDPDAPGAMLSPAWSWAGGSVQIFNFAGLDASTRYRVRLLVIGGE